jgi:hypothetical protein
MGSHHRESRYTLGTGVLTLTIDANRARPELFRVAERINPKRSFLFVSTVLGRHIPVRPRDHFAAVDGVVDQVVDRLLEGPVLVMGYAETAVGIGAAVARRISRRRADQPTWYQSTTRHPVYGLSWAGFSEGHSHATAHHVMRPEPSLLCGAPITLVLVDDETTTGSTFAALIGALKGGGVPIGRVLLLTLTDWSGGQAIRAVSEAVPGVPVDAFSLMRGRWGWARDAAAVPPDVPVWPGSVRTPVWRPDRSGAPLLRAPRIAIRMGEADGLDRLANRVLPADRGAPVLVIGTGEHVWGPMLLAERLEQAGAEVRLVATTRSPILQGEVIRHKLTFPDHFGLGVPMYLHNVPPRPNAHVIIMTETDANGVCPELRSHLGRGQIVDGAAQVTEFGTK